MAVRKLSSRHIRFSIARALVRSVPRLSTRMPYYDRIRSMLEAGEAQVLTDTQNLALDEEGLAFAAKLPEYPQREIERSIALITLRDVTVLGSTGSVIDERHEQLLVPRDARDFVSYHDFRPVVSTAVSKPDALYFNMMAGHRGYRHYFHFMFDRLPRLYYLLNRFNTGREPIIVLVNADLPQFQKDIFRFVQESNPNIRFEAIPRKERWRLRRLLQLDDYQPIKRTLGDPKMLAFVRSLIYGGYGIPQRSSGTRRIYVSRNDTPRRRVTNEHELLPILDRFGFEVVSPGTLNFREQVDLFANAEAVVGPHGAGLTNILFSPNTTRVLELFPATKVKNTYFLLAISLGQTYRALIGGSGSRKEWFEIDPGELEGQLSGILSQPVAGAGTD